MTLDHLNQSSEAARLVIRVSMPFLSFEYNSQNNQNIQFHFFLLLLTIENLSQFSRIRILSNEAH